MKKLRLFGVAIWFSTTARIASAIGGIDSPPPPSPPQETTFTELKEAELPNGLRIIVAERPGLPLLAARLLVRKGAEVDPKELAGAASMTGSLLIKGTEKMSAPEIARAIESLGGEIEAGARWDSSQATVIVMSNKAETALEILADVVLHPAFQEAEIDRLKNQTLDNLRVELQEPGSLARFVTARVVFGEGEYGHAIDGTMESVEAIKRDDIVRLYQTHYVPQNAVLILAGDITLAQGTKYAQKFFGDWEGATAVTNDLSAASTSSNWEPANVVIDMPTAGQAAVTVARPAIARDAPDYYAALVANAALGNGFISRLNREIRIKRGLSYGVRSSLEPRRGVGPFIASAQTKNQSAAEVAGLLRGELQRLMTEPVQGEELKSRQAVLTGGYARRLETNVGFAEQIATLANYDLPLETLNKFIPSVNAVKPDDVSAFAAKYFDSPSSLVIVGQAAEFLEGLKKSFPGVRVIPQSDLDLNRAELTKTK